MPKNWVTEFLKALLTVMSGPMRELIIASIKEWEKKAAETAQPWDDIFVGIVKWLLQIP